MQNPLQGWDIIPKATLKRYIHDSFARDKDFRERERKACQEFYKRIDRTADNKRKVVILKEIAAKYGFRESWFITRVHF